MSATRFPTQITSIGKICLLVSAEHQTFLHPDFPAPSPPAAVFDV
jgi:hypothetical protein